MRLLSVKTRERGIDLDGPAQRPREPPVRLGPLEAHETPAGIGPAARRLALRDELPVPDGETQELALRGAAAAADAASDRLGHSGSSRASSGTPEGSIGMPAGPPVGGACP